jgi:hypothetical protein
MLAAVAASAQAPAGRVIGSVEIPVLHDPVNKETPTAGPIALTLYREPRDNAQPAVTIKTRREIESLEHGYEQISAAVLDVRAQAGKTWYLVQYKREDRLMAAWLSGSNAGRFRSLPELLKGRGFLTQAWNGWLYKSPRSEGSRENILSALGERRHVVFADMAEDAGQMWFLVVVVDGTICDGGPRSVLAAGWIPAHSASGQLNAWYYSRGC